MNEVSSPLKTVSPTRRYGPNLEFHYEIPWSPAGSRPGHHESLGRGAGFRFREHLPLARDPDARRIDLHATLRNPFGDIMVRSFRERRAIVLHVLADLSASMRFGGKWPALARFTAAAAHSAYRTGDSFGFRGASQNIEPALTLDPGRSRGAAVQLEARLLATTPGGDSSAGLLEAAQRLGRRRSLVFVVSDFHWPLAQCRALFDALSPHAVVPVIVWDPAEFSLPDRAGWYEARDLESGHRRTLWLRPRWRTAVNMGLRQRQEELRALFLDAGARPLALDLPFDAHQVTEYFAGGGGWADVAA